eukprot:1159635-Pelagomonas_calceolata.AAC.6
MLSVCCPIPAGTAAAAAAAAEMLPAEVLPSEAPKNAVCLLSRAGRDCLRISTEHKCIALRSRDGLTALNVTFSSAIWRYTASYQVSAIYQCRSL